MPELPEVETTRRGLEPHLTGARVLGCLVREPRLRWPVPDDLPQRLTGARLLGIERRAKYLLLRFDGVTLMAHLGMSGSLRLVAPDTPPLTHDHVDVLFERGETRWLLRLNDPRRFGSLHLLESGSDTHPLLDALGPEPLSGDFGGDLLYRLSRGRRAPVKTFIMDAAVVVGVGNIYATEALFRAGIHPRRPAGRIGPERYRALADAIRAVLGAALEMGGTTLRDFVGSDGRPGYFRQSLMAYGREGEPCRRCGTVLRGERLGQRATVFCPRCQR